MCLWNINFNIYHKVTHLWHFHASCSYSNDKFYAVTPLGSSRSLEVLFCMQLVKSPPTLQLLLMPAHPLVL